MTITAQAASDRTPHRNPYDRDMAKRELMGIQELRLHLKDVIARVTGGEDEPGEHVVFTRHNKRLAVLVPIDWYREAAKKMDDPTEY